MHGLITIRDEQPGDVVAVRQVNRQAFARDLEARIVDTLRDNSAAALSLVAIDGGTVVGHIMFSPLSVGSVAGVGLGPMAVAPRHQRRGVGAALSAWASNDCDVQAVRSSSSSAIQLFTRASGFSRRRRLD
jgi:putative acetyltransferase